MKFYFSTKQIPQLRDLPIRERMLALERSALKMTIPERTLLNVLKLLVIVPIFVFILQTGDDWTSLIWAGLVFLIYPLFVKPLQYSLSAKYLPDNVKEDV